MNTRSDKPSFVRRIGRGLVTLTLTTGFIAASAAAVVFGLDMLNERATAAPPPVEADIVPVSVKPVLVEPGYDVERRFVGQIESQKSVDLSFELSGRLVAVDVDEGDAVTKGQVVGTLDTELLLADRDRLVASRDALTAQLTFARQEVTRSEKLTQDGFASRQRLDQSIATRDELVARIAETDASLASVEIRIRKSELIAPFSGYVAERRVDGGETLTAGQPVLRLIDNGATTVRVGIPLDIDTTRLEQTEVEIGGQRLTARLDSIRPDIDTVTRTRTAILTVEGVGEMGLGRTATVILTDRIPTPGAWVPLDSVKEGRGSVWTVLVVDEADVVRNAAVEILHAEADRLYVRGSFQDGAQMIRTGPQRVTPGQTVRVIEGD